MPQFDYEALDANDRPVNGQVEATSVAHAATQLEALGLAIRSITRAVEAELPAEPLLPELAAAVRRLLDRREEVLPPLAAFAREAPGREQRGAIRATVKTLESGDLDRVAAAVAHNPTPWAPLLAAATRPDESFLTRVTQVPIASDSPQRNRAALVAYPLLVLLVTLLILWPLAATVIPVFSGLFSEFGLELPVATELVLGVAGFLSKGGAIVLAILAAAAAAAYTTWPQWGGTIARGPLGRFLPAPKLPDGVVAVRGQVAADLLRSGLPAEHAYPLAGITSTNRSATDWVTRAAIPESKVPAILEALSTCYAEQSSWRAASYAAAMGAVAIVLVGIAVGFTVIALFLPLVCLIGGLS